MKEKITILFKTIILFVCYLTYTNLTYKLFAFTNVSKILLSFIADLIFLIGIILVFNKYLKKDFDDFKKNINHYFLTIAICVLILFKNYWIR